MYGTGLYLEVGMGRGIGPPDSTLVTPSVKHQSEQRIKKGSFSYPERNSKVQLVHREEPSTRDRWASVA